MHCFYCFIVLFLQETCSFSRRPSSSHRHPPFQPPQRFLKYFVIAPSPENGSDIEKLPLPLVPASNSIKGPWRSSNPPPYVARDPSDSSLKQDVLQSLNSFFPFRPFDGGRHPAPPVPFLPLFFLMAASPPTPFNRTISPSNLDYLAASSAQLASPACVQSPAF